MTIENSRIIKTRNRGNGSLHVMEQHTDHLGIIHEHRYYCAVDHDIDQALLDWVPKLESSLVQQEKQEVQERIENGGDPALITRKYITTKQKAEHIVKALMLGSPKKMLKAAEYVNSFSDTQIEKFFTVAQRIRIRERALYIIDNQAILGADIREEL